MTNRRDILDKAYKPSARRERAPDDANRQTRFPPLQTLEHVLESAQSDISSQLPIVELDASLIEPSLYRDRLGAITDDPSFPDLVEDIRVNGQVVPILIRNNDAGRWQCAYGHRRLEACKQLGRKVRAIVQELSDLDLLRAQIRENMSRKEVTFLERALLCERLVTNHGLMQHQVADLLATDRSLINRYITLAQTLDETIISCTGPAPEIGRTKWIAFAEALRSGDAEARNRVHAVCKHELDQRNEGGEPTNPRQLMQRLIAATRVPTTRSSTTDQDHQDDMHEIQVDGKTKIKRVDRRSTTQFHLPAQSEFADWLWNEMPTLFQRWSNNSDPGT